MVPEVLSIAVERGYRDIIKDKEKPVRENLVIDEKKTDGMYRLNESEEMNLKEKERQM